MVVLYNMSVAGVRVVEFGPNGANVDGRSIWKGDRPYVLDMDQKCSKIGRPRHFCGPDRKK